MTPGSASYVGDSAEGSYTRRRVTLRFIATPQEANISGRFVSAGSILEWIDKAGYVCAVGWSSSYCVTAYVGNVHFTRPITPGELVEVRAQIVHTGRSSMQVLVQVSSADIRRGKYEPAMHCLLVFVAVDDGGAPVPVPAWTPENGQDALLSSNARQRVLVRQAIHREMNQATFSDAGTTPRTVFRFLALPRDTNFGGKAHGGTVMRWINEAAYACAAEWSSTTSAAIYTGGVHFHRPIRIGDVVEVDARLIHTTPDSMHLSVHVRTKDPSDSGPAHLATQCVAIFAERDLGTTQIAPLPLVSEEDRALDQLARRLVQMRATLPRVPNGRNDDR